MGLSIQTGFLADLKINDLEGYDETKKSFNSLNRILRKYGVKEQFVEPGGTGDS